MYPAAQRARAGREHGASVCPREELVDGEETRRMILASNRLPVTVASTPEGAAELRPSSGGLASALREYHEAGDGTWVGWLGDTSQLDEATVRQLTVQATAKRLKPVALTREDVALFYDGYSNTVLWPLFHYLLDK